MRSCFKKNQNSGIFNTEKNNNYDLGAVVGMRAKSLGDRILQGENLEVKVFSSVLVTFTYSWGEVLTNTTF